MVFLLFFAIFTTVSGAPARSHGDHVYSREQLVAFRDPAGLLPKVRPDVGDCGSVGSRSVFQSRGWRFNARPSRCVLEQDT